MANVRVKICGITNSEDAFAAVRLGADYIGLNFYSKSPRYLNFSAAKEIVRNFSGPAKIIGVFVNEELELIGEAIREIPLHGIQLHGDESADLAADIAEKLNIPVIKAYRIKPDDDPASIKIRDNVDVLLDAFTEKEFGGTGKTIDWTFAQKISAGTKRLFLAGGLRAENVAAAIKIVKPFAVDVCSSIEKAPGIKDFETMKRFIEAVKTI